MINLDRCYCPSCCVPVACRSVAHGYALECPECGYTAEGTGRAPTLRRMLSGAEPDALWMDVNLPRWTRLIAGTRLIAWMQP